MKPRTTTGPNVISMFGYKCETQFPAINQVEAYWEGLRMGRMVPMRSEIDPRGIERALEYTFILERIAPGLARFRLSGMHLNDLLGMEVRGMPFTSFFTPKARREITDILEMVFDGPQTAELILSGERSLGKPALDAKLILLPLRSDLGEVTRIIGALVSSGPMGRAPRRFNVESRKMKTLTAGKKPMIAPETTLIDTPATAPAKSADFGFAEPAAPFATAYQDTAHAPLEQPRKTRRQEKGPDAKGPDAKRPALRLVKSDE